MNRYPEAHVNYDYSSHATDYNVLTHNRDKRRDSDTNTTMYEAHFNLMPARNRTLMARGPEYKRETDNYNKDSSEKFLDDYMARNHKSHMCGDDSGFCPHMDAHRSRMQSQVRKSSHFQAKPVRSHHSAMSHMDSDADSGVQSRYNALRMQQPEFSHQMPAHRISQQPSLRDGSSMTHEGYESSTAHQSYMKGSKPMTIEHFRKNTSMRFRQEMD